MKNKIQLAIFVIWTAAMSPTFSQNNSATCKGTDVSKWNNCIGESTIYEGDLFLRYEGPWKNGQYNGFGILTIHTGSKYTGEFKNNLYHGQGTFIWPDGRKYVGAYINGKRNGQGIMTYADGSNYVGEWKDGLRAGRGIIYMSNGSTASDGLWANDKLLSSEDKTSDASYDLNRKLDQTEQPAQTTSAAQVAQEALLRRWKDTGFPVSQLPLCTTNASVKCFGSGKDSNGHEYIGEFDNGYLIGRGITIYSNGDKYVGEYNKGINGQGIYYFSSPGFQGTIYVGEFRDNIQSGNGIYFNAGGTVVESGLYSKNLIEYRFVDPAIFTRIPFEKIPVISSAARAAIESKQAEIAKKQVEDQRAAALAREESAKKEREKEAAILKQENEKQAAKRQSQLANGEKIELKQTPGNCTRLVGMAKNVYQMIAQTIGVSLREIEFIGGEYGTSPSGGCAVVVDTPKGIKRCSFLMMLEGGDGKPFAQTMIGPGNLPCN